MESSSRLDGCVERVVVVEVGELSTSMSWLVITSCLAKVPRFRVSLSPPTETKVALDLSPISLAGESPVAMLGFFLGLIIELISFEVFSSAFFISARFSSSAFAFSRLFL